MNHSFVVGVYLAANAVRDAVVLVDGPDCAFFKGQLVYGRHDAVSTLYRQGAPHRIRYTGASVDDVALERGGRIASDVRAAASQPGAAVVILTSLPMCTVTSPDYGRIAREASAEGEAHVVEVPGRSLRGDWIDGYADTLASLARHIRLPSVRTDPDKVAVVGHLMDRNEGDQRGNVREMERLLAGIALSTSSVWLSGGPVEELARAAEAGTIVSLPAGREAARLLARRTGAQVVETDVPLGLASTRRWVETVAAAAGRAGRAARFVDAELTRVARRIDRLVHLCLLDREAVIVGEPFVAVALERTLAELGCRTARAALQARPEHLGRLVEPPPGPGPWCEPLLDELVEDLQARGAPPSDVAVVPGEHAPHFRAHVPVVELGFPSLGYHVLREAPFMGFEGTLELVGRLASAMLSW
jgi:nitrogenase molybdenum-iron protein alpha/beta subunit